MARPPRCKRCKHAPHGTDQCTGVNEVGRRIRSRIRCSCYGDGPIVVARPAPARREVVDIDALLAEPEADAH